MTDKTQREAELVLNITARVSGQLPFPVFYWMFFQLCQTLIVHSSAALCDYRSLSGEHCNARR